MAMRGGFAKKKKKKPRRGFETRARGAKVKLADIDYKETALLQRMTTAQGKLYSRKRSGLDATCQRALSLAIKRARFMALMPYVT